MEKNQFQSVFVNSLSEIHSHLRRSDSIRNGLPFHPSSFLPWQ